MGKVYVVVECDVAERDDQKTDEEVAMRSVRNALELAAVVNKVTGGVPQNKTVMCGVAGIMEYHAADTVTPKNGATE